MRYPLCLLVLFAVLPAAAQEPLAITDVAVVDVADGSLHLGQTVVVAGDRIAAVGAAGEVEVPDDATVIDASEQYLIPGLWDMHVHTSSDPITREVLYPLFVAHGVTGVRNMRADCFETGAGACESLDSPIARERERRREVEAGTLVGPRAVAGSAFANGPGPGGVSTVQGAGTAEHARAFVRLAAERGADFVKVYDLVPREAYFALADEADRLGIPFAGHVPLAVRASEASDAGQRSVEHVGAGNVLEECSAREGDLRPRVIAELGTEEPEMLPLMLAMVESYDAEKCAALFARFAENGTWVTPTLMVSRLPNEVGPGWREDPRLRYVPREERELFAAMEAAYEAVLGGGRSTEPYVRWVRRVTREMGRAGVPLLAGSDAGDPGIFWGSSLHEELGLLVEAGLTAAEALRTATLNPARYLGRTDDLGTVEVGKLADLVLLEANPLEDIENTQRIRAVVTDGRYFDRADLDALLEGAARTVREGAVADTVLALTEAYNAAWEALDPEAILAFHPDDLRYYYRGSGGMSSKAAFEGVLREEILPAMRSWSMGVVDPHVEVLGPDAAVVSFAFDTDVVGASGRPYDYRSGALTYVFERRGGSWKIVLMHESAPVPE